MLKDHNHDLVHQLSEISDSVWRIDRMYRDDSKDCTSCSALWSKLEYDYRGHIAMLTDEIKKHIKEERFD